MTELPQVSWENLHDAVLLTASLDWEEGTASIVLQTNEAYVPTSSDVTISARGVKEFTWSRLHPWGPSVYVNTVQLTEYEEGNGNVLELEMQTGDVIRVDASEISIDA